MLKTPPTQGAFLCRSVTGCSSSSPPKNRAQFYLEFASGPFYGYNRSGAKVSQRVIDNWWWQAMMGGPKAQYGCVQALS